MDSFSGDTKVKIGEDGGKKGEEKGEKGEGRKPNTSRTEKRGTTAQVEVGVFLVVEEEEGEIEVGVGKFLRDCRILDVFKVCY